MSMTLARLQQLKRQAGGARVPAPSAHAVAPTVDRLRSMLRLHERRALPNTSLDRSLPGTLIAPGLHYAEEFLPEGVLPDFFDGAFDRGDTICPEDLLFFDTETTGLAGGTGTRAFMVGVADWHQRSLRIRQLTIATMSAESAMLDTLASWVHPSSILCSYNGKCYDAPLLATRYRLARRQHPLAGLRHVDLLYPTRRRYRGAFENCRLATIEREVLRIVREDDLPGSEAPAAWLGFLRGGNSALLKRVQAHNRQDVITLAGLFRHLSELGAVVRD